MDFLFLPRATTTSAAEAGIPRYGSDRLLEPQTANHLRPVSRAKSARGAVACAAQRSEDEAYEAVRALRSWFRPLLNRRPVLAVAGEVNQTA